MTLPDKWNCGIIEPVYVNLFALGIRMKKKYYLEAVRITAVLLVMYNHSAPFMSFATQHGVQYAVSFFLSLVCKAAVPLFYMVSGALLLGKMKALGNLRGREFCVLWR